MTFISKITIKVNSFHMFRTFANRANPGLDYRVNAIKDVTEVIESDPEGFEGLEADLFNAHKSHKEHELEQFLQHEKTRLCLVKAKYFRKKLPNLLIYAEKEQIKYLHSSDQEEWSVEKLAEYFPANVDIISKVTKSRWTAISPKRIRLHDASVMKNWERFRNGEYKTSMPKELEEHLKQFVNRNTNDIKIPETPKQWQKPTSNEFSSIISTLNKRSSDGIQPIVLIENKPKLTDIDSICLKNETYLQEKIKNKKVITIHELKIKHDLYKQDDNLLPSNANNVCNQLPLEKHESDKETAKKNNAPTSNYNDFYKKFAFNEINITKYDKERYGISDTKQRIHIPKKLWRKGATYRANNCYYDDDGELLYKVPIIF